MTIPKRNRQKVKATDLLITLSRADRQGTVPYHQAKYVSDHTDISVFGRISTERTHNLHVEIPRRFAQSPDERDFFPRLQRAYVRTCNANRTNKLCDI